MTQKEAIRSMIHVLFADGDLYEIRMGLGAKPGSAYLKAGTDDDALNAIVAKHPGETFYMTLNAIDSSLYCRTQCRRLVMGCKTMTSDKDIRRYRWFLIDLDPRRPSGISATDEEKAAAHAKAQLIYKHLRSRGFCDPVVADSGNGYHLLYRIDASVEDKETVATALKVLSMWYSDEQVEIDTTVGNPARITKLYGTMATKGANTPERPHRMSQLISVP